MTVSTFEFEKFKDGMDERFRSHGMRIASLDSLFQANSKNEEKLQEHSKIHAKLQSDLSDEANKRSQVSKSIDELKEEHHRVFISLSDGLSKVMKSQSSLGDILSGMQKIQSDHVSKLFSVSSHSDDIASLKSSNEVQKNVIDQHKKVIFDQMEGHISYIKELFSSLKDLKDLVQSFASVDHEAIRKKDKEAMTDYIENVSKLLKDAISHHEKFVGSSLEDMRRSMKESLSNIKVPSSQDLDNASKAAQVLSTQQNIILDSKNAILRSTNNEMKIATLEKKVEKLLLLTARLELSQ